MSLLRKAEAWNLDLDRYVNRIVPPSPLHRLPTPVSRFLGYRKEQKQDVGNILGAFWSCVGGFCGLAVIAAVFNNTESIQMRHPPTMIASFVSLPFVTSRRPTHGEACGRLYFVPLSFSIRPNSPATLLPMRFASSLTSSDVKGSAGIECT